MAHNSTTLTELFLIFKITSQSKEFSSAPNQVKQYFFFVGGCGGDSLN